MKKKATRMITAWVTVGVILILSISGCSHKIMTTPNILRLKTYYASNQKEGVLWVIRVTGLKHSQVNADAIKMLACMVSLLQDTIETRLIEVTSNLKIDSSKAYPGVIIFTPGKEKEIYRAVLEKFQFAAGIIFSKYTDNKKVHLTIQQASLRTDSTNKYVRVMDAQNQKDLLWTLCNIPYGLQFGDTVVSNEQNPFFICNFPSLTNKEYDQILLEKRR